MQTQYMNTVIAYHQNYEYFTICPRTYEYFTICLHIYEYITTCSRIYVYATAYHHTYGNCYSLSSYL